MKRPIFDDKNRPTLLLLSGGIESGTLLHMLADEGPLIPLFVDYAQRAASRERAAATAQCAVLDLELETLELGSVGETFRRGLSWQPHVPLPQRNLVLLALALSLAEARRATRICLALNREDTADYPSAATGFVHDFAALAGRISGIAVETPLIELDKAAIIRLGVDLGVDYSLTYSCLLGRPAPCGGCPQCLKRHTAFAAAGVADPATNLPENPP